MNSVNQPGFPVRLVQALSRAHLTPFDENDWSGWAGAVGDAQVVRFHKRDADYLRAALEIEHWPEEHTFVVLDDSGLTWNGSSPVNGEAWQVCVGFGLLVDDRGDVHEIWRVEPRMVPGLEARIAALPDRVRSLVMAAPHEARPFIVAGHEEKLVDRARLRQAVEMLQQTDFSEMPGLFDMIPWARLEAAAR